MKILYFSLSFLLLLACNTKQKVVEISIDPKRAGWYFVEVKANNGEDLKPVIKVRFHTSLRYRQISAKDLNEYLFKAYDLEGNEISERMKLAATFSHHSGRKFFKFYNPTDTELRGKRLVAHKCGLSASTKQGKDRVSYSASGD